MGLEPEGYAAFHPRPLPPDPPLSIDAELQGLLDRANQALGRLDGITLLLPDPEQFLYSYVRKEAVLSSQIEGTQSSLSDLLLFEADAAPGAPLSDARDFQLHRCHEPRSRATTGRGATNLQSSLPRSSQRAARIRSRLREDAGKIPARAELDWRVAPVDRTLRAAALGGGRAGDARAGEIPPLST